MSHEKIKNEYLKKIKKINKFNKIIMIRTIH